MNPLYFRREKPCKHCGGVVAYISNKQCVVCNKSKRNGNRTRNQQARKAAELKGDVRYTNYTPCKNGHFVRYTNSGACVECSAAKVKLWRSNPENLARETQWKREWRANNLPYLKIKQRINYERRRAKAKESASCPA